MHSIEEAPANLQELMFPLITSVSQLMSPPLNITKTKPKVPPVLNYREQGGRVGFAVHD